MHPIVVIIAICAIYVVLGTAMESLSMMLLTVPVFFPLVTSLGFDPVWFGIIIVCVIEISLITPPVGMNIFVLSSVMPDLPTIDDLARRHAVHLRRHAAHGGADRLSGDQPGSCRGGSTS